MPTQEAIDQWVDHDADEFRWFRPDEAQLSLIQQHSGERIVEPFCGDHPLFDLLSTKPISSIGIDHGRGMAQPSKAFKRRDIIKSDFREWMKGNSRVFEMADTIMMSYPPMEGMDNWRNYQDLLALEHMMPHQTLILGAARPWGCLTVTGSRAFWSYLINHFWLVAESAEFSISQTLYVLKKRYVENAIPAKDIMQGHDIFELVL